MKIGIDIDGVILDYERSDLTRNAFIMASTKHINGEIWR